MGRRVAVGAAVGVRVAAGVALTTLVAAGPAGVGEDAGAAQLHNMKRVINARERQAFLTINSPFLRDRIRASKVRGPS